MLYQKEVLSDAPDLSCILQLVESLRYFFKVDPTLATLKKILNTHSMESIEYVIGDALAKNKENIEFDLVYTDFIKLYIAEELPSLELERPVFDISFDLDKVEEGLLLILNLLTIMLPDEKVSVSDMFSFGYNYFGMYPLTKRRAKDILEGTNLTVYKLLADNTEEKVTLGLDSEGYAGLFGVERESWDKYVLSLYM